MNKKLYSLVAGVGIAAALLAIGAVSPWDQNFPGNITVKTNVLANGVVVTNNLTLLNGQLTPTDNTLDISDGTDAINAYIFKTVSGADFERLQVGYSSFFGGYFIGSDAGGAGSHRSLTLYGNGVGLGINGTGTILSLDASGSTLVGRSIITNATASASLLTLNGNSANNWILQANIDGTSYGGITNTGSWLFPNGSASRPSIGFMSDSDGTGTGFYRSGANQFKISVNGNDTVEFRPIEIRIPSAVTLNWNADTFLMRESANTLTLLNGTNAQTMRVSTTRTDASNYRRLTLYGDINLGSPGLFAEGLGTGANPSLHLGVIGTGNVSLWSNGSIRWTINSSGHLIAGVDNTYDIGAAATTRPRSVFVGPSGGFGSSATNATVVVSATGATNTLGVNVVLYVTAATGASLTDNAGTTEFSDVTIANFTPIRMQPGGKFVGTGVTYATGTSSHAW